MPSWPWPFGIDRRRRRQHARTPPGPLREYLAVPFPDRGAAIDAVTLLAVDLETTGLDPARHEILSIGLVELRAGRIDLGSAAHCLIRPEGPISAQSASVHLITGTDAERGIGLAEALDALLPRLAGRVVLGHNVRFDLRFLAAACRRVYGQPLLIPAIDTQALARAWLDRRHQPYGPQDLRLAALRQRFHLPQHRAHDALSDALATAELFLALRATLDRQGRTPLKRWLEV